MNLVFQEIHIHNFLSIGDSVIDLSETGYTLVQGINLCVEDNSKSNGSGKSSIWQAIIWALTGQTTRKCKNIVNLYGDDGCFVQLKFMIDDKSVTVLRSKDHKKYKTDLKFYINDVDKSGKGIKESERLFKETFPDLDSSLIGSVIILGQGLPSKFSDNTPSGRKELLENLSKSDFMIQHIKFKISERKSILGVDLQKNTRQKIVLETQNSSVQKQLQELCDKKISDQEITELQKQLNELDIVSNMQEELEQIKLSQKDAMTEYNALLQLQDEEISNNSKQFQEEISIIKSNVDKQQRMVLEKLSEKNQLLVQIKKLESIKDICPTCGQKIPNVVKPDTTKQKEQLSLINENIEELQLKQNEYQNKRQLKQNEWQECLRSIKQKYIEKRTALNDRLQELSKKSDQITKAISAVQTKRIELQTRLNIIKKEKQTLKSRIQEKEIQLEKIKSELLYIYDEIQNTEKRLAVLSKFQTIAKRDFRGYLLSNIIDIINIKAKQYGNIVFGNELLSVELNGNNIDIKFGGKMYENLSGGEKQKVDLIIQFAIRDMLCKTSNFSCSMLVLDQIFDNLDEFGCQKVLNLIESKLVDIKSVYLVTHRANSLSIPYDYKITVVKDKLGISGVN